MNLKQKAHGIVFQETKKKTIIKPKHCSICKTDRRRLVAHHKDYNKPREVLWLCDRCHKMVHNSICGDYNPLLLLECPKCFNTNVRTTLKDRWCKICGYRTKNVKRFVVKKK